MTYTIGFSSGMFYISEAGEKENFLTMPRKMFRGALEGVKFTQIDIESINEFREPGLQDGIRRMRNMGLRFGFHGESYAMGGGEKPMGMLDSSIAADYAHSHERLLMHIKECGSIGGEFVNIHPSETTPFSRLGKDLQPTRLVDFWGRSLRKFLEDHEKIFKWLIRVMDVEEGKDPLIDSRLRRYAVQNEHYYRRDMKDELKRDLTEEDEQKIKIKSWKEAIRDYVDSNDLEHGAEKISYIVIAKWMQENDDPLWRDIVGEEIKDEEFESKHEKWVPAVSAKYIWGHFNPIKDDKNPYKDPKPLLKDYNLLFVFETQMGSAGIEGMYRLQYPSHMAKLCKIIGSPYVGVCFDFEHVMSQNIDPKKDIEDMTGDLAKYVRVCHLGWPTPHVPAHMPIPLGSEGQEYLYKRLYELRQRGMKDAYFIFERAGAGRETTILAIRKIKEYLEKDKDPENLEMDFYGMDENGPDIKRQEVAIRDHFFEPLKGMLQFPEEEYTFLSKAATEKGKAELWKKEQYR